MQKAVERITHSIEAQGGEVHRVHDQGRKKLAYQINGHKQGAYFVLYFSAPPESISVMWREYQLNEDLIRFMTLRTEKILEKIEFEPLIET